MSLAHLPLFTHRDRAQRTHKDPARLLADFEQFHRAHPEVYAHLVKFAREWRATDPTRRIGIKALYERVRWETNVRRDRAQGELKLNNNHTAHYARLIMAQETDLADAFETRQHHDA